MCNGMNCLDMTEVFNFIKSVKELDLYGKAHACCEDDPNAACTCPDSEENKAQDDLCMFDYCMSWDSLYGKLNMVNDAKNNDTLGMALVPSLGGFMAWMGANKDFRFANHVDGFYLQTGKVAMIASAALAALYGAQPVVDAAVKTEYYNGTANYVGANFLAYGGNSFVGDLLGLFEVSWVIAYLGLAADIAIVPLVLAYEMDLTYSKAAGAVTADELTAVDFQYMFYAFIVAFGSWMSAVAMQKSASRLIGFFDIQDTDALNYYNTAFGSDPSFGNGTWLLVDIILHTVTTDAYFAIATGLSVITQVFVHMALTGQTDLIQ